MTYSGVESKIQSTSMAPVEEAGWLPTVVVKEEQVWDLRNSLSVLVYG